MLLDAEKQRNQRLNWQTREITTDPANPLFEVYAVESGDIAATDLPTLKQAGKVISDLRTYGMIQPTHTS